MATDSSSEIFAFATGLAIGGILGILYAPDSGAVTRKLVKEKTLETKNEWEYRLAHAAAELTRATESRQQEFRRKLNEALMEMEHKSDEVLAALETRLDQLKKENTATKVSKPATKATNKKGQAPKSK